MIERTQAYGLDFLTAAADMGVGKSLREFGEFARPEMELIAEIVGAGTYVDVGANIGSIALPVARTASRVIAIEANREIAGLLAGNAVNNGLHNVAVHHAAVGETRRLAKFPMMPLSAMGNLGTSGFHHAGTYPDEVVQMTTLDDIAPGDTTIVKIDVEGYELQVLRGAGRVLKEIRPAWLVESSGDTPGNRAVMDLFRQAGYRLWWFMAPFVTPQSERSGDPALRNKGDFNIVALPDGREPIWPMPPVTGGQPSPILVKDYPYLARYGYERKDWASPST